MISCNGDEENSTHDSVIIRGWEDYSNVIGVFGERKQTTNGRQKEKHYTSASYTFTSQKTHSPQKITKYRRNELEI